MSPRNPFLYKTKSDRWQVISGKLLPLPGKMLLQPGINAVELASDGKSADDTQARIIAERKGWRIVPVDCIPQSHKDELGADTYLWTPEGRPDVVLGLYEKAFSGTATTQADTARWVEFLEFLVAEGHADNCPDYVITRMIDDRETSIAGHIDKVDAQPSVAAHVKRKTAEIEVLQAELAKRESAGKRKPAKGKGFRPTKGEA